MSTSSTPHGFTAVRRGYRPEQVDRFVSRLCEERDAAWERAARLTVLAKEMADEAARLRAAAEALGPASYESLGEGAQELLRLVEEEAAEVAGQAGAEAARIVADAEAAARARREEARQAAHRERAAAEEWAADHVAQVREQAAELRGAAQAEADGLREEGEALLDRVRADLALMAARQETAHRERLDAWRKELAGRTAAADRRVAELAERAERLLDEAQQEHS